MSIDLAERVDLAIDHGNEAYINTEGNLDFALRAAIQYYTESILEHLDEIKGKL